jgi:mRNA interferase MazF
MLILTLCAVPSRRGRPVLVLQNDTINVYTTTVLIAPFTTNLRCAALPSCVLVKAGEGGLAADSVLLCHHTRSVDQSRLRDRQGEVSAETMLAVENCLLYTLGISLVGETPVSEDDEAA